MSRFKYFETEIASDCWSIGLQQLRLTLMQIESFGGNKKRKVCDIGQEENATCNKQQQCLSSYNKKHMLI